MDFWEKITGVLIFAAIVLSVSRLNEGAFLGWSAAAFFWVGLIQTVDFNRKEVD